MSDEMICPAMGVMESLNKTRLYNTSLVNHYCIIAIITDGCNTLTVSVRSQ